MWASHSVLTECVCTYVGMIPKLAISENVICLRINIKRDSVNEILLKKLRTEEMKYSVSWTSAQDFRFRIVCLLAHAAYKQGQRKNRTHRETAIAGIPPPRTLGSWPSEEHPSSAGRNITTAEIPLHPATQRTRSLWCCNTPRSSLLGSLLDGARGGIVCTALLAAPAGCQLEKHGAAEFVVLPCRSNHTAGTLQRWNRRAGTDHATDADRGGGANTKPQKWTAQSRESALACLWRSLQSARISL